MLPSPGFKMEPLDISAWKETFFQNTFSVDQCLTEYTQKSDLETLRKDLKNYGAELQLHMSEILKNETEAIVNLAEYLTNLNSKINNLSVPVSQLREETRTLHDLIKTEEHGYGVMLLDIKNNNSQQNHVHLKLGIINSSVYINTVVDNIETDHIENLFTLERIVNKYSFQKIYLEELHLMTQDIERVVKNVESKLVSRINSSFLEAFNNEDKDILLRCLRMYIDLQKQDEAHYAFQKHVIEPEFKPLFNESHLEKCGHDLGKIYLEVKKVLADKVEILTKLINDYPDLDCFNFVLQSFWTEFDVQSREGLPHITAPGNPELFQKRFTSTYDLLKHIALKAGDENLVKENESFQSHLKRFNLPVYFEIKFQQIAGNFESGIVNLNLHNIAAPQNEHSFKLKPSVVLWNALVSCFNVDVYIDQLADHFIRLVMMLLSRYINLMEKLLNNIVTSEVSKESIDDVIVNVLIDLSIIGSLAAPKYQNNADIVSTIYRVINPNMWQVLLKVFKANERAILKFQNTLKCQVVSSKVANCTAQLQSVTAIPRLYRRTNRSPPKEASLYMIEAVKPILDFQRRFRSSLDQLLDDIVNSIIVSLANQYLSLVQEVLMSVCKTEESLRRLKSRTLNTGGDESVLGSTDTMTDETKIREQIKYDVGYFCDKLYPIGKGHARDTMDLLKKEVYV